jgi:hypothetical protein
MTRIDIAGEEGAFAILRRKPGSDIILAEILQPGRMRRMAAGARDEEAQRRMAEIIQKAIDGHPGTPSMVGDYHRLIEQLAD